MCIAIAVPAGVQVPYEHLQNGYKRNPDGCGMAWIEDGQVQIFKSMSFDTWSDKYHEVLSRCGLINMLIHFRITSRGETSEEMCHPFMINNNMALIHNGTINAIKPAEHGTDSDTKYLCEEILADMPDGWVNNVACHRLLGEFIGWSKLCILTDQDEIFLVNEEKGIWFENVWYSNSSYETPKVIIYPINKYKKDNTFEYNSQDKTKNYSDVSCDGCHKDFNYAHLTYKYGELLCDTCLANQTFIPFSTKPEVKIDTAEIQRPCGCCRTMTDEQRMYGTQIEFWKSLVVDESPLDLFQSDLINVDYNDPTILLIDLCPECYHWVSNNSDHTLFRDVAVDAYPSKWDDEDEEAIYNSFKNTYCVY